MWWNICIACIYSHDKLKSRELRPRLDDNGNGDGDDGDDGNNDDGAVNSKRRVPMRLHRLMNAILSRDGVACIDRVK